MMSRQLRLFMKFISYLIMGFLSCSLFGCAQHESKPVSFAGKWVSSDASVGTLEINVISDGERFKVSKVLPLQRQQPEDLQVFDGKYLYTRGSAEEGDGDLEVSRNNLGAIIFWEMNAYRHFRPRKIGEGGLVAGHQTNRFEGMSHDAKLNLWVDRETGVILKSSVSLSSQSIVTECKEIKYGPVLYVFAKP